MPRPEASRNEREHADDCATHWDLAAECTCTPSEGQINAREDWEHRACPECGDVFQWPVTRDEIPVCNHTGRLVFGHEYNGSDWTPTVPVEVVRR